MAVFTPALKRCYHAVVPAPVRYPLGRLRRRLLDHGRRLLTAGPHPPRKLLRSVQLTPYLREYQEVGRKSATAVREAFESAGVGAAAEAKVLDFGCGLGRTLHPLLRAGVQWRLHGCDVDVDTVAWSRRAFPTVRFERTAPSPPLPYPEAAFDAVYAISVFTHFDAEEQKAWAVELTRVVRPGGIAALSLMGPHAFGSFRELATEKNRRRLLEEGFHFDPGGKSFNQRGAFHTEEGIKNLFTPAFDLLSWRQGALDGFQDLALLRRRKTRPSASPS